MVFALLLVSTGRLLVFAWYRGFQTAPPSFYLFESMCLYWWAYIQFGLHNYFSVTSTANPLHVVFFTHLQRPHHQQQGHDFRPSLLVRLFLWSCSLDCLHTSLAGCCTCTTPQGGAQSAEYSSLSGSGNLHLWHHFLVGNACKVLMESVWFD